MALVMLDCPDCGNRMEVDDAADIVFCTRCGRMMNIEQRIGEVYVGDLPDDLRSLIESAKGSLAGGNAYHAKAAAEKALGIDPDCRDAMLVLEAVITLNGGDASALRSLTSKCGRSLGIFTEKDLAEMSRIRILITFLSGKMTIMGFPAMVDRMYDVEMRDRVPCGIDLTRGYHTLDFRIGIQSFSFPFRAVDSGDEYVLVPVSGREMMSLVPVKDYARAPWSPAEHPVYVDVTLVLPKDPVFYDQNFKRFDVYDGSKRVVSGRPGEEGTFRAGRYKYLVLKVVQVTDQTKSLGKKDGDHVLILVRNGGRYELYLSDGEFRIRKV